jgi:hypothetical protein
MAILNTNDGTASAGALAEAGALSNASAAQQTGTTKKVSSKQASKAKTKGTTAGEPVRSSISGREAEEIRRASNYQGRADPQKAAHCEGRQPGDAEGRYRLAGSFAGSCPLQ